MPAMTTTASTPTEADDGKDKTLPGTIGFLGTGNMAEALIKGMLTAGLVKPEQIGTAALAKCQRQCRSLDARLPATIGRESIA